VRHRERPGKIWRVDGDLSGLDEPTRDGEVHRTALGVDDPHEPKQPIDRHMRRAPGQAVQFLRSCGLGSGLQRRLGDAGPGRLGADGRVARDAAREVRFNLSELPLGEGDPVRVEVASRLHAF
jgi:hypothetical protein